MNISQFWDVSRMMMMIIFNSSVATTSSRLGIYSNLGSYEISVVKFHPFMRKKSI